MISWTTREKKNHNKCWSVEVPHTFEIIHKYCFQRFNFHLLLLYIVCIHSFKTHSEVNFIALNIKWVNFHNYLIKFTHFYQTHIPKTSTIGQINKSTFFLITKQAFHWSFWAFVVSLKKQYTSPKSVTNYNQVNNQ